MKIALAVTLCLAISPRAFAAEFRRQGAPARSIGGHERKYRRFGLVAGGLLAAFVALASALTWR